MERTTIQDRQERARVFWLVALLVLILTPIPGLTVAIAGVWRGWLGSDLLALAAVPLAVAWWLAWGSLGLGHCRYRALREEEDRFLLEQRKRQSASVFEGEDEYLHRYERARVKFERFGPGVMLFGTVALLIGLLVGFWLSWEGRTATGAMLAATRVAAPGPAAFMALLMAMATMFGGVFCIGQSRETECRWLRAVGAWLMLAALICALASVALICRYLELPDWDRQGRMIGGIGLLLLALELLGNFIVEFYRPRTREVRPIFESRLLALFTEPGGVMRNVADTLDYQFGFKASGTWAYQVSERALIPLVLFWAITLWLLTTIVEVGYGEEGVRERFGVAQLDEPPLGPGIYLKLPWPGERIACYPVGELREIVVGSQVQSSGAGSSVNANAVVLWTVSHYDREARYLVATKPTPGGAGTPGGVKAALVEDVPVSFLSAMLPIQYRINEVRKFAYRHQDAVATLQALADREVANLLASADLLQVMSTGRAEVTRELARRLQAAADRADLGIEVVEVNFHDAHPPVEQVAPSFQAVVGAQEEQEATILAARSYERQVLPGARGEASRQLGLAQSEADRAVKVAAAEVGRFGQQVLAYRAMPAMFILRSYLEFLEQDCLTARKFIVPDSKRDEVFILNLEEKARLDLLSTDLADLREEAKPTPKPQ